MRTFVRRGLGVMEETVAGKHARLMLCTENAVYQLRPLGRNHGTSMAGGSAVTGRIRPSLARMCTPPAVMGQAREFDEILNVEAGEILAQVNCIEDHLCRGFVGVTGMA